LGLIPKPLGPCLSSGRAVKGGVRDIPEGVGNEIQRVCGNGHMAFNPEVVRESS